MRIVWGPAQFCIGAAWLLALAFESTGHAQKDEQRAAARAAATEGVKAYDAGRYQEAVDYCTRAEAIMHAPTHLLLIARANARLGKLVEAQEAYFRIQRDTLAPNAPPAFVEAQRKAVEEQATLAPRVPSLRVDLDGATASEVTVSLDGAPLPAALIGIAGPINPGDHRLEARGTQLASEPVNVSVAEGARDVVTLFVKPIAATPSLSPGAEAAPMRAEAAHDETPTGGSPLRTGGWIGLGIGAVGLVVGTVFVVQNRSDRGDANALCQSGCPESKRAQISALDDSANSAATLAWVSYGVGAAALATGAIFLWLSGSKHPASAQVTPLIGPRSAGVAVGF